jgi:hypothetical protein
MACEVRIKYRGKKRSQRIDLRLLTRLSSLCPWRTLPGMVPYGTQETSKHIVKIVHRLKMFMGMISISGN